MPPIPPDHPHPIRLAPRLTLHPGSQWHGRADPLAASAVLGDPGAAPDIAGALSLFSAAEPPIELEIHPGSAVLGGEQAGRGALEYQPDEPAVYALLHAI